MYWLNIRGLNGVLQQRELSSREVAQYLGAQAVLYSWFFIPSPDGTGPDWPLVVDPLVALLGVYYCYRCNGGGAGLRLAERSLAIGWVVTCGSFL
jgi:hypothetical protein